MAIFKKISAFYGRFCKKFIVKTRYEMFESELKSLRFFVTLKDILILVMITAAIVYFITSREWADAMAKVFFWGGILILITFVFYVRIGFQLRVFCNDQSFINSDEAIMIIIATYLSSRRHFKFILKHVFPDQLKGIDDDVPRFPDHF